MGRLRARRRRGGAARVAAHDLDREHRPDPSSLTERHRGDQADAPAGREGAARGLAEGKDRHRPADRPPRGRGRGRAGAHPRRVRAQAFLRRRAVPLGAGVREGIRGYLVFCIWYLVYCRRRHTKY